MAVRRDCRRKSKERGDAARTEILLDTRISIRDLIAQNYDSLSPQLRLAADYVSENLQDVSSRSLRTVAADSSLKPPTFSRLARALGLATYEDMRELCRKEILNRSLSFSEKARVLRTDGGEDPDGTGMPFALRQAASAIANIERFSHDLDIAKLRAVADRLIMSRKVFLAGSLSSAGFVQYLGYLTSLAFDNWRVVDNGTASLPMVVTDLTDNDAVVVILKDPYAARSVNAARFAAEAGAFVVVISNQVSCPAFQYATQRFIVPSDSPQFFSSYAATLVLIECLAGMLVRRTGPDAQARLAEVESNGHRLGEYWPMT
jgi:DNA-binding MurR/RpiR family transcriptional regulator